MRSEGYSSCLVCVCLSVCLSVTHILANRAIRRPTKGSSGLDMIKKIKELFSIKTEVMVEFSWVKACRSILWGKSSELYFNDRAF